MRFLIPPGQAGAGTRLRPRRFACRAEAVTASGSISAREHCQGESCTSRSVFCSGRRGRSGDAGRDRGAVRLHRDCRHHRHVRGYRRHVKAGASSLRAVDADHHLLLFPFVGADAEARRSCCSLRSKQPKINYIATADFLNLMDLADFEMIRQEQRQLLPRRWLGLGPFINRFIAPLPGIRQLCLRTYLVGRPSGCFRIANSRSASSIPCRNEKGNIENAILRMPRFGARAGNPVRRGKFQRRHV